MSYYTVVHIVTDDPQPTNMWCLELSKQLPWTSHYSLHKDAAEEAAINLCLLPGTYLLLAKSYANGAVHCGILFTVKSDGTVKQGPDVATSPMAQAVTRVTHWPPK